MEGHLEARYVDWRTRLAEKLEEGTENLPTWITMRSSKRIHNFFGDSPQILPWQRAVHLEFQLFLFHLGLDDFHNAHVGNDAAVWSGGILESLRRFRRYSLGKPRS